MLQGPTNNPARPWRGSVFRPAPSGWAASHATGDVRPRRCRAIRCGSNEPFDMMAREVTTRDFQAFATSFRTADAAPARVVCRCVTSARQRHVGRGRGVLWLDGRPPTDGRGMGICGARRTRRIGCFPGATSSRGEANALLTVPTETWAETAPAGSFPPNGFGLHDMAGNVWEWTASLHRPTHDADPPEDGYDQRTIKGGSWNNAPRQLRVSDRTGLSRRGRHNLYVGFRCARSVAGRP